MKILFLDQYGVLGGGQQVLTELVRAALNCDCAVTVLIPSGPAAEQCAKLGAQVRHLSQLALRPGKKGLPDILKLCLYTLRLLSQNLRSLRGADLLYANSGRVMPAAWLASLLFRKQAVYHIHLDLAGFERRLYLWTLKTALTRLVVVPSEYILRRLRAYSATFGDKRVTVLENGLDERFARLPYENHFSGRSLRQVGIIGRVSPEKGQDILLTLAPAFSEMTFHVFGDAAFGNSAYYRRLRESAPANVLFHGWVDNLPAKAREVGLQACLIPSRWGDALPLVGMQATILSCLTVVRNQGALADMAQSLNMPVFEHDDELPAVFRRLLAAEPEELSAATRASYERASALYGHKMYRQRLRDFFRRLSSGAKAAHA